MASGDPLHEAFAPPSVSPLPEPRASFDARLVRLSLVVLILAVVVHGLATTVMQVELFDPRARWGTELYAAALSVHGLSRYTIVGPVLLFLIPALVLPSVVEIDFPRSRLPSYLALAAWGGGTLLVPIPGHIGLGLPLAVWGALALMLANVVYGAGLARAALGGGWATFWGAAVVRLGLLLLAVGFVVLVVLEVLPDTPLPAILGDRAPLGFAVVSPGLLALTLVALEPRRLATGSRPVPRWAAVVVMMGLALSSTGLGALMLPVLPFVLVRAARPLLLGRACLREPDALALLLVLLALGLGAVAATFLGTLSVDVHLHDTYFVTSLQHFDATALLLLLVAAIMSSAPAWRSRAPHRGVALVGVLGLSLGLLIATSAMVVLGQQGMPRRYAAYVPQFEALHQRVGMCGAIAAMGLVLLGVALARGRRASDDG